MKMLPGRGCSTFVVATMASLQDAHDPVALESSIFTNSAYMFRLNRIYGKLGKRFQKTRSARDHDRFVRFESMRRPIFKMYDVLVEHHAVLSGYHVIVASFDGSLRSYGAGEYR